MALELTAQTPAQSKNDFSRSALVNNVILNSVTKGATGLMNQYLYDMQSGKAFPQSPYHQIAAISQNPEFKSLMTGQSKLRQTTPTFQNKFMKAYQPNYFSGLSRAGSIAKPFLKTPAAVENFNRNQIGQFSKIAYKKPEVTYRGSYGNQTSTPASVVNKERDNFLKKIK